MRRLAQAVILGSTVLFTTALAQADDKVSIRYLPGYPLPSHSADWVDVRIEHVGSSTTAGEQAIDRFFASVEATLSEYRIVRDWQLVIPDAPSIEITVDVSGRRIRLTSTHAPIERTGKHVVTERGLETLDPRTLDSALAQQSEQFQRHRLAFERVLALRHMRMRLSP